MEDKTIQIQVQGGVVIDVVNVPDGYDYEIVDLDKLFENMLKGGQK